MPSIPRSAALAASSAVAGAVLFGVAAGGVASVDGELRSAAAPPARFQTVDYRATEKPAWDCPAAPRHAPARDWDEI